MQVSVSLKIGEVGWKEGTSDAMDEFYKQYGNNFSWDVLGLEGFLMCGLMDY